MPVFSPRLLWGGIVSVPRTHSAPAAVSTAKPPCHPPTSPPANCPPPSAVTNAMDSTESRLASASP